MVQDILAKENINRIVRMVGSGHYFTDLEVLQKAIDKPGALPQNYFGRDENFCAETWGYHWRSKEDLRTIRETLIAEFIEKIKSQNDLPYQKKMDSDHYARYFHALSILKVDKSLIRHTNNDFIRNAFIELWQFDNGSKEAWTHISDAAWFISEAIKGFKGEPMRKTIYPEE